MFWDGYRRVGDRSVARSHAHSTHAPQRWTAGIIVTALTIALALSTVVTAGDASARHRRQVDPAGGSHHVGGAVATPTATPSPTPTPTVSAQKIAQFGNWGTPAQFLALMKDMSIDVIEMAAGTYFGWHLFFDVDRTARPLTVRPAAGATVIFDDSGGETSDGLFYPGWSSYTSNITFQGPFQVTNYVIGQTGLVSTAWVANLTFNRFVVKGTTAPTTNGQTAWAVYVSSDGTHRGSNLTFNDWNVDNSQSGHKVSGLQIYHTPQAVGISALRWTVTGGFWGIVGRGDATAVVIDGWTIGNTVYPFDSDSGESGRGPAGTVSNMTSTGSANAPIITSPMVDGGGNSWN